MNAQPWHSLTREEANALYLDVMESKDANAMRELCLTDLFFLLTIALRRIDADDDWLYSRVREVEAEPNGCLDLWAREHYKSTIITFALTIQDILRDPEITVGLFSHTRPIAKAFLKQIKTELENNTFLKNLFPDVLYGEPDKEAPTWSLDGGITVKRKTNPAMCTVEAWGLVDGMPTSKHYRLLIFDDVVTQASVSTPEQIAKTTESWALALSLGSVHGNIRYIGTYYHFNDTWHEIEKRQAAKIRKHSGTVDGKPDGKPVWFTPETLARKRREMGPYVFSCQILLNPIADDNQNLKEEWLRYYDNALDLGGMNLYLIVDPANAKKKNNDYTVMAVIGLAPDNNYYLVYGVRDRLNLVERTKLLFSLVRRFQPRGVGYEQYGMQADIQHIKYVQHQQNFHFHITELGGPMPKPDRIKRLVPIFENSRFWLPRRLLFRDCEGKTRDFIMELVNEEYLIHPLSPHDDMLDDIARIVDQELAAVFPVIDESDWRHDSVGERVPRKLNQTNCSYDVLAPRSHARKVEVS